MLDILVVALVVFALKARPFADAEVAPAAFAFLAAVVLIAYAGRAVGRAIEAAERAGRPASEAA